MLNFFKVYAKSDYKTEMKLFILMYILYIHLNLHILGKRIIFLAFNENKKYKRYSCKTKGKAIDIKGMSMRGG
jgi:hypothetical protein